MFPSKEEYLENFCASARTFFPFLNHNMCLSSCSPRSLWPLWSVYYCSCYPEDLLFFPNKILFFLVFPSLLLHAQKQVDQNCFIRRGINQFEISYHHFGIKTQLIHFSVPLWFWKSWHNCGWENLIIWLHLTTRSSVDSRSCEGNCLAKTVNFSSTFTSKTEHR